ncbi:MAG: hypothetical protein IH892_02130 [Planctomycetes bacterium]|nr:hypothetical protein [Planctomycetota bacterium]
MALQKNEITDIFSNRHCREKTILTWRGFRTIKLLDKPAVLRDIWNAISREINEQRAFLEAEVLNMRQQIEVEKEKSGADLVASAPRYFIEELRVLCKELEKEVDGQLAVLPDGMSSVLERIRVVLGQNFDEQLQVVDRMEKGSLEHMEKLRRRLVRMAKDLQLSEEEVARLREALTTTPDGGLASVYNSVQGLSTDEVNFQKKTDLLKRLFEQNLDIRKSSA